jgi:hypothetical protein
MKKKNKPYRILHNIGLYDETPIYPGLFYAVDKSGWGRVYTAEKFLGLAMPNNLGTPHKYKVSIWGELSPERKFTRRTYHSQVTANRWLIRHAKRLANIQGFAF